MELSEREVQRYNRQIMIPGWGEDGQSRLKKATVAVIGAGGLGSTILMQLAAAGFGRIVLADADTVELGNLNRQVLHWETDIGRVKVHSAGEKLRKLNGEVQIVALPERIDESNVGTALADADGIIDALDNMESRFVANRYAVSRGIPLFHGAVWGLEGRLMTVVPGEGPCLRCIYPEDILKETPPVAGVTPSVIGALQVAEAIKFFTGLGAVLKDSLLVCDLEIMEFTRLTTRRDPDCPVCAGAKPARDRAPQ